MKLSKKQLIKAAKYSAAIALVFPAISLLFYIVSLAPAPIAFGAILGLITFPFFTYHFR